MNAEITYIQPEPTLIEHGEDVAVYLRAQTEVWNALTEAENGIRLQKGKLLIEVKQRVPHGAYQDWIQHHLNITVDTARNYYNLAANLPEIESYDDNAYMLSAVYAVLRRNPTPEVLGATRQLIEGAATGKNEPLDRQGAIILRYAPPVVRDQFLEQEISKPHALIVAKAYQFAGKHPDLLAVLEQHQVHTAHEAHYLQALKQREIDTANSARPSLSFSDVRESGQYTGIGNWSVAVGKATETDLSRHKVDRQAMAIDERLAHTVKKLGGHVRLLRVQGKWVADLDNLIGIPETLDGAQVVIEIRYKES